EQPGHHLSRRRVLRRLRDRGVHGVDPHPGLDVVQPLVGADHGGVPEPLRARGDGGRRPGRRAGDRVLLGQLDRL
ncbi:MAG: hypothetical protein AVDCRST_MAG85-1958, partial [uncultured Solirubrobacteraceae bacterium]